MSQERTVEFQFSIGDHVTLAALVDADTKATPALEIRFQRVSWGAGGSAEKSYFVRVIHRYSWVESIAFLKSDTLATGEILLPESELAALPKEMDDWIFHKSAAGATL